MDERVIAGTTALVAYILWRRGVLQNAWAALWGQSQRAPAANTNASLVGLLLSAGGANPPPNTNAGAPSGDLWQQSGCNPGNYSCLSAWQKLGNATGGDAAVIAAEPAGLTATIKQYGNDLWNYCLAFVNQTRQAAGLGVGVYGAARARDTCNQLSLRPGIAPPGATVCFSNNHIGIASGGDQYVSAGLIHGGLTTLPYVNNPAYAGWSL